MKIAIGLEYDGQAFHGWQSQPHGNTVQDVLEGALAAIAGLPVRTHCAGRTDTGVHALAQVAHFDTDVVRPVSAWVRGVNAHLPPGVAVNWAVPVADDFHARFCAIRRTYCYWLLNRPVRPALFAGKVGWCHAPLNVNAMSSAAQQLRGEHDFSAFRAAQCQAKSPIKTLHAIEISQHDDLICFQLSANGFLHHMVRNIVGALVYVGLGRFPAAWLGEVLRQRERARAAPTFAAAGLYFSGVEYGQEWRLPGSGRIIVPHPWLPGGARS